MENLMSCIMASLSTISHVYYATTEDIHAHDYFLRPTLPYVACIIFVSLINHFIPRAYVDSIKYLKIIDMALVALLQRLCLYAGIMPIGTFYDTLICVIPVMIVHMVVEALYVLSRLSRGTKKLADMILQIVRLENPVKQVAALHGLRRTLGIVGPEDDEGDEDHDEEDGTDDGDDDGNDDDEDDENADQEEEVPELEEAARLFGRVFGLEPSPLAIYRPKHHRHGLYRFRESSGTREIDGKYILDPFDADSNKPFLLHIRDKDDQHCTICSLFIKDSAIVASMSETMALSDLCSRHLLEHIYG